ncbi:MAG: hypothetical protein CL840_13255 [Crocinitomicaceae bacterium]|nr:hypothetical protein [Crocinitomicaceae bacterium]|tara:strand:- start:5619 stop:6308 length:690 start_codon:yes stop_codon:yes gene_type:complete
MNFARLTFIIVFINLTPDICLAQSNSNNSKNYFVFVNESKPVMIQKIKLTSSDTVTFLFHEYRFKEIDGVQYVISTLKDGQKRLVSLMEDEITEKGLKHISGRTYEYDNEGNQSVYEVKGPKKIMLPFIPLSEMKGWKTKFKHSYSNKATVKSKMECLGYETISTTKGKIKILQFKRTAMYKYEKEYFEDEFKIEYVMSFAKGQGLIAYEQIGDGTKLKGEVIKYSRSY